MPEPLRPTEDLSLVKQALLEIRRLRAQLAEQTSADAEPVAIIGMAVRFPAGITSLDDFWTMLAAGNHGITTTPSDRWDEAGMFDANASTPGKTYSRHGGFLNDVSHFDAAFFGITPREAESMDPQQRILLELTWEALEHAGIAPTRLSGTSAGVFIGLSNSDYGRLLFQTRESIDAYSSFGIASSIAAGRISYFLDARGPSLVVDTACSSSLAALHLACQSLRGKQSSLALVGAANLMLSPEATISFSHARMLAPDGQCKTFDAAANGYVRGEGCAVIVLKPLQAAEAAGDHVLAVIRGCAVNHDGRSAGLTAPNGPAQEAVIAAALQDAELAPADVDYVEAHGTGTPLGDPIELQALGAVYGKGRPIDQPLLIGSVKTNLGHLEAAAGLAGLVKTVLALQHQVLPPHRNFSIPNPHADWASLPVSVVADRRPWPRSEQPRRAGLSSFGFSGTNVHVILEEPPLASATTTTPPAGREELFVLSARSPAALRDLADRYVEWLDRGEAHLADICYSASIGRAHHPHRLAVVAKDRTSLITELQAWLASGSSNELRVAVAEANPPRIGLFCPSWMASAQDYASVLRTMSASFATAWANFAKAVSDTALVSAPAQTFALQYVLGQFWSSLGLAPSAIFGTGAGELAAASLSGGLTPTDALARLRDGAAAPPEKILLSGQPARPGYADAELLLVLGNEAGVAQQHIVALGASADAAWTGVLQALKALYLLGADPVWDTLYRGETRRKLELPRYPFQRQRFWHPSLAPTAQKPDPGLPIAVAVADWPKLLAATATQSETGPLGWNTTSYSTRWQRCDELTTGHAINVLVALGAFTQAGARATADELVSRHGILPAYRNLLRRWLTLLAQSGALRQDGDSFISPAPLQHRDLAGVWRDVEQLLADDPDVLAYAQRTSGKLQALLTGQVNPLEVMFPHGSLDAAEGIYERSPAARYFNGMVEAAVRSALEQHSGGGFRLVEVGAGTGGTTSCLAPGFPADGEYWFTDVSDAFLARARTRFGANPAFRFTRFDLNQPPPAALQPGQSDVVVAANVIHATEDVSVTLDHLRALLKPGGVLVLIETTTYQSVFDLTIAFLPGWSSFKDSDRTHHPLLEADQWITLLKERGFTEAERFPKAGSAADQVGQHVVIARNSLHAPSHAAPSPACRAAPEHIPLQPPPSEVSSGSWNDRARLEAFIRQCAAEIMHLDPTAGLGPRERFTDLGMDSLMALQLKANLALGLGLDEAQLPATIAFDSGTVEALTDQILKLIAPVRATEADGSAIAAIQARNHLTAEDLQRFSEDEVEALLTQRILAGQAPAEP